MSLGIAMMGMPSVSNFVQELTADLERGRSVLALFPSSVDYTLLAQTLLERLRQRDYDIRVLSLPDLTGETALPTALAHALDVQWQSKLIPQTVENLAANDRLPDVIFLQRYEEMTADRCSELLAFMRRWGAVGQSVEARGRRPCSLCLLLSADSLPEQPPPPDLWLSVRWWWARLSALEVRLLCRCIDENVGHELGLCDRWREYVMPSLVGNDVNLVEHLWDDLTQDTDQLVRRLQLWAEWKNWTKDFLEMWSGKDFLSTMARRDGHYTATPPSLRDIWAHGMINWTPEYGAMVSPAVLAVLGQVREIEHRLWRGQVSLLLPLIDSLRLALCEQWTARYGPSWPSRWQSPVSEFEARAVQEDPLASGLGHIESLLRNVRELQRERSALPLITHARYVRNELAHYRPIRFSDFEAIWHDSQAEKWQSGLRVR